MTEREQQPASMTQFRRLRVPTGVVIFLHDPKAKVASFILLGALFLFSEPPRVGAPFSWSDAVRWGLPRPAGGGCSTGSW